MYPIDSFVFYCLMITFGSFRAIKFYQLEVQCNFPIYLRSCVKYKLILLWQTVRNFCGFAGILKNQSLNYDQYNIKTSSIRKHFLPLWFGFLCCFIHFYCRKFFQPFLFFSYLTIIIFSCWSLFFLKYLCIKQSTCYATRNNHYYLADTYIGLYF